MQSENINELGAALAKAQAVITGAKQDKKNPFLKNNYATLSSVWDACRAPLTDNGLCVVQTTEYNEQGQLVLATTLIHSSGQWLKGFTPILVQKQDAQSMGSAITYARRYSLSAIAGVAPDDGEDDGSQATSPRGNAKEGQPIQKRQPAQEKPKVSAGVISEKQVNLLYARLNGNDDIKQQIEGRLESQGIENYKDIPREMFDRIIKFIDGEIAKKTEAASCTH